VSDDNNVIAILFIFILKVSCAKLHKISRFFLNIILFNIHFEGKEGGGKENYLLEFPLARRGWKVNYLFEFPLARKWWKVNWE
jgi:hypothetical protein